MSEPPNPRAVAAWTDDALGTSDATELLERLAEREVSPAELREAAEARARATDDRLGATTRWVPQPAGRAAPSDDAPLAGLPFALKDNEALAGHPTSNGSWTMPDTPNAESAPITRLLLGLGLDPIALTTLPEFGLTAVTESTRFGATRNPWDTDRTPGGSSGGSAALVAAGVVPIAHANDGGGSIRIPAACCGLVGLKPSRGRLPDSVGVDRLPVQVTVQGVLTRTVRDTALFYALAERALPAQNLPPIGHVTAPGRARLRIGMCATDSLGPAVSADTVRAVRATGSLLESLGHDVVEVGAPVSARFGPDFLELWSLLAFLLHRTGRTLYGPGFDPSRAEEFTRGMSARLIRRPVATATALRRLRRLAHDHEAAFSGYDALVAPVTAHPAPLVGHLGPHVAFHDHLVRLLRFSGSTSVQNVSGSPAISLPLGRTAEGLPIGVHLAAPYGHERRLLQLAHELEQAAPWPRVPGPVG